METTNIGYVFICLLVSPHSHGIVNQEVAPSVRRGLTLLSKVRSSLNIIIKVNKVSESIHFHFYI